MEPFAPAASAVKAVPTDEHNGDLALRLPQSVIKELSELNQAKSAVAAILEWVGVIAAVWLCETFWNPALYVLTVLWIGTRLHGMGVLMHEGAHYRLFKNRKLNDYIGEIFFAFPLTVTMFGFRQSHLAHHRELNSDKDPDWAQDVKRPEFMFPKTKVEIGAICFKYLIGYYAIAEMKNAAGFRVKIPRDINILRIVVFGSVLAAAIHFGWVTQLILYWIVPLSTSLLLLLYVRAVAEHHAGPQHTHIFNESRTTLLSWWESLLIFPHQINHHIEHHFYPGVPFYNLPKLHRELARFQAYRQNAHVTRGVFNGLLNECLTCRSRSVQKKSDTTGAVPIKDRTS